MEPIVAALFEPFAYSFMVRALVVSVLVGIMCPVLGSYVVSRGLGFMGDALAHAVLPGMVVAILLGVSPFFGAIPAGIGVAVLIGYLTRRTGVSEDTSIGILITHGHIDHIGGLDRVQEAIGAPVRCHPKLAEKLEDILGPDIVVPLKSREVLKTGGDVSVQALFTPGHEIDHVCYYIRSDKVMFTGDTVLGASSTSVRDLSSYMKSLEMLTRFKFDTICPAHGPVVPPPRGARLVDGYMSHRQQREQQVIDALAKGCDSVEDITKNMYPRNLKKGLVRTAQGNVRTHLEKLVKEGKASETASKYKLA